MSAIDLVLISLSLMFEWWFGSGDIGFGVFRDDMLFSVDVASEDKDCAVFLFFQDEDCKYRANLELRTLSTHKMYQNCIMTPRCG